eukprot:gnl/MRDRNA2_/MRDRNA2_96882_c0_seq1.p1 gnl/MRDRNA2_/MRDRNA2_96882_c0~~gnl/MRDRNA2_/MRDRNA2_96882_c0_seq1.p1  ORF type:complete len:422 (-),score=100.70 gnl/MRDRNA2_/MRDRNA2_96882_c0_seq1:41-1306(-)
MIVSGGGGVCDRYQVDNVEYAESTGWVPLGRAASRCSPNLTPIGHMCGALDVLRNRAHFALRKYSDRPLSSALNFSVSQRSRRRSPTGRRRQPPSVAASPQSPYNNIWKEDNTDSYWKDSLGASYYASGQPRTAWGSLEEQVRNSSTEPTSPSYVKTPNSSQRNSGGPGNRNSITQKENSSSFKRMSFGLVVKVGSGQMEEQQTPKVPSSVSRRKSAEKSPEKSPSKQKTWEAAGEEEKRRTSTSEQAKAENKQEGEAIVGRKGVFGRKKKGRTLEELILSRNGEIALGDEEDEGWAKDDDDDDADDAAGYAHKVANLIAGHTNPSDSDFFTSDAKDRRGSDAEPQEILLQPGSETDKNVALTGVVQKKIERARQSIIVAEKEFDRKRASIEIDADVEMPQKAAVDDSPLEQLSRRLSNLQ